MTNQNFSRNCREAGSKRHTNIGGKKFWVMTAYKNPDHFSTHSCRRQNNLGFSCNQKLDRFSGAELLLPIKDTKTAVSPLPEDLSRTGFWLVRDAIKRDESWSGSASRPVPCRTIHTFPLQAPSPSRFFPCTDSCTVSAHTVRIIETAGFSLPPAATPGLRRWTDREQSETMGREACSKRKRHSKQRRS